MYSLKDSVALGQTYAAGCIALLTATYRFQRGAAKEEMAKVLPKGWPCSIGWFGGIHSGGEVDGRRVSVEILGVLKPWRGGMEATIITVEPASGSWSLEPDRSKWTFWTTPLFDATSSYADAGPCGWSDFRLYSNEPKGAAKVLASWKKKGFAESAGEAHPALMWAQASGGRAVWQFRDRVRSAKQLKALVDLCLESSAV